jgi:hypothetical protein
MPRFRPVEAPERSSLTIVDVNVTIVVSVGIEKIRGQEMSVPSGVAGGEADGRDGRLNRGPVTSGT